MKLLFLCLLLSVQSSDLYEALKSSVQKLNQSNWSNQVQKGIQNGQIYLVHFYNPGDGKSYDFSLDFEEKAGKLKGIVNFGFVNCKVNPATCKSYGPTTLPALRLFPPVPIPHQDLGLDTKTAINQAVKYVKNFAQVVKNDNFLGFTKVDPTIPKVLYFSDNDKEVIPLVIKALSVSFNKKISFGYIPKGQRDPADHFKIRKFPSLIVLQSEHQKPSVFSGEFNFKSLHDYLNIFSQQFVPESKGAGQDDKPWLFKAIPEFHKKSSKDVCLGQEKVLCIIVFTPGEITPELENQLKETKSKLDETNTNFMLKVTWINSHKHKDWVEKMGVQNKDKVTVRVLRTGRRVKYIEMEEDFSTKGVQRLIERVIGGDTRSVNLRSGIPEFAEEL